jgi:hypothetical protein
MSDSTSAAAHPQDLDLFSVVVLPVASVSRQCSLGSTGRTHLSIHIGEPVLFDVGKAIVFLGNVD